MDLELYRASTNCIVSKTGCDKEMEKKMWNYVINQEKYRRIVTLGGNRERAMKNRSLGRVGKYGAWPLSTWPHRVISAPARIFVMRFVSFQCFLLKHILHVLSDKVHGITTINRIFNNCYSMRVLTLSVGIMDSEITGCDWRKEQHWGKYMFIQAKSPLLNRYAACQTCCNSVKRHNPL